MLIIDVHEFINVLSIQNPIAQMLNSLTSQHILNTKYVWLVQQWLIQQNLYLVLLCIERKMKNNEEKKRISVSKQTQNKNHRIVDI